MIALGLPCVEQSRGGEECVYNLHLLPGGWNQGVGNIEERLPLSQAEGTLFTLWSEINHPFEGKRERWT